MSAQHTPRPWVVSDTDYVIRAPGLGFPRENIANPYLGGKSLREREANARLIAAAPELLEALEAVEAEGMENHNTRCKPWWAQVRAAITKARGQA